jgi:hypothetical protein
MTDQSTLAQAVNDLLLLAPHVELAGHTPGRITFRLKLSALSVAQSLDSARLAKELPGILKTDLKLFSRTVVIDYDPARLPPAVWEELGALGADPARLETARARLTGILEGRTA